MEDCLFCKIAKGEIPCHKVWEDEEFLCFLDINSVIEGHVLVIPKKHCENVCDCDDELLGKLNVICKKIGLMLKDKLGATGFNVVNASGKDAQQSVFHLHFHVVARYPEDGIDMWFHGKGELKDRLEEIAKKIRGDN